MKKLLSLILASGLLLIAPACHRGGCGSCGTDQYHHEHMERSCTKCGENPCGCKVRRAACDTCHRRKCVCDRPCRTCELPMRDCHCK